MAGLRSIMDNESGKRKADRLAGEILQMAYASLLLDVRETDEFQSGHIPGAVKLPRSRIDRAERDKSTPLFAYCLRGTRSRQAVAKLSRMDDTKLKSLGGVTGYTGKGER